MSTDFYNSSSAESVNPNRKILKPNPSPRISVYRRKTCRGCESADLTLVLPLNPTPLADAYVAHEHLSIKQECYPLDVYLCGRCGLAQLLDVVSASDLYIDYIYETSSSLGLKAHFRSYAEAVFSTCSLQKGAFVVDIGSNDGTLLGAFKELGCKVLGVDPAKSIAEVATSNGIKTLPEFFTAETVKTIQAEWGSPDVISANNIVANVDDLRQFLTDIRSLLKPGGVFVFESYYLADLIKNMVFDFIYHEHLTSFTVKAVEYVCNDLGLSLISATKVSTKGGSLRYYIQKPAAGVTPKPDVSVQLLRADEEAMGVTEPTTFSTFAERVKEQKERTLEQLTALKSKGLPIAAFGASATSTTLMYHFELTNLIDFLVDDYDVKQGLYSPGCHLPVFAPSKLIDDKIDTTLVLAWRYWKEIGTRHRQYFENGGKFLIPLPSTRILSHIS